MSVLVSEHAIAGLELGACEAVTLGLETVMEEPKAKWFPNVVSVFPVLILIEASLVMAGVASYHFGMLLLTRAHVIH